MLGLENFVTSNTLLDYFSMLKCAQNKIEENYYTTESSYKADMISSVAEECFLTTCTL